MRRTLILTFTMMLLSVIAGGQQRLTFTGTALTYGSGFNTRTTTRQFALRLTGETSDADANRYLGILRDKGQDALLRAIDNQDLGSLTIGGRIAPRINAVRVEDVGGMRRVRVVFERWLNFEELRGGYRSADYPFGYMEIMYDPRTGRGDGTFISAARIRFRESRNQVEIEDFGTFPGRLIQVRVSGDRRR